MSRPAAVAGPQATDTTKPATFTPATTPATPVQVRPPISGDRIAAPPRRDAGPSEASAPHFLARVNEGRVSVPYASPGRVLNLALIIMIGTGLSRILGLVRESLISDRFGSNASTDAFALADNVQSTIFELTTNGVLQAAMIPALSGLLIAGAGGLPQVRRAMGALLTLILLFTGTLSVAGIIWAPAVVALMTQLVPSKGGPDPHTVRLATELVRWILPAVPLLGVGSVLMAGLHAVGRPAAPSFGSATRNLLFIATAIALSGVFGIQSLALGTVFGAFGIVVLQLPALRRSGLIVWPNLRLGHPVVGTVTRLSIPVTAGLIVTTVVTVLDRNLAVNVSEGTITSMRYATTLVQTVLGLVAAAVSLASLPSLSRHHEAGDHDAFSETLRRAMVIITLLMIPVTLGLATLSRPVVGLVFQHGATGAADADQIQRALLWYLPGTIAAGYAQILLFAFYARKNTLTPLLITVVSALGYAATAFGLVGWLGMVGLVLANSVQWVVTLLGALILGHHRIRGLVALPRAAIAVSFMGGGGAAGVALALGAATHALDSDASTALRLFTVTISALMGFGVYAVVLLVAVRRFRVDLDLPDRLNTILAGHR